MPNEGKEKAVQEDARLIIEEEGILLAGALNDKGVAVRVARMRERDFSCRQHRIMYRLVRKLVVNKEPVGSITMHRQALRDGVLDALGGPAYIADIAGSFIGVSFCVSAYKSVREHSMRRALVKACERIHEEAMNPSRNPEKLIDDACRYLRSVWEKSNVKA